MFSSKLQFFKQRVRKQCTMTLSQQKISSRGLPFFIQTLAASMQAASQASHLSWPPGPSAVHQESQAIHCLCSTHCYEHPRMPVDMPSLQVNLCSCFIADIQLSDCQRSPITREDAGLPLPLSFQRPSGAAKIFSHQSLQVGLKFYSVQKILNSSTSGIQSQQTQPVT